MKRIDGTIALAAMGLLVTMTTAPNATADPDSLVTADSIQAPAAPFGVTPAARAKKSHDFTFRSHPYPETRAFTILQFGALGALSEPYYGAKKMKLTMDVGGMGNLNEHWAVGANFRVESDATEDATGLMLRGRRWLGRDASIDIATGFLQHDSNGPPLENSWVNQAQLNIGNVGSITVEMQTYKLNGMDFDQNGQYGMRTESGTMWLMGGSFHYLPGVIAFLGFGALVAATWD